VNPESRSRPAFPEAGQFYHSPVDNTL